MVRLVCLEDEDNNDLGARFQQSRAVVKGDGRYNPNVNGFSAALSCYPIVSQLASLLDLNSLHDLSRTCRQFRANLLQYRTMLKTLTLRCDNGSRDVAQDSSKHNDNLDSRTYRSKILSSRITSGKVGPCVRDMVGECRKCSRIVCRNCIAKPPHPRELKGRHRRLCKVCMKSPLSKLTSVAPGDCEWTSSSVESFTDSAFARTPCTCPTTVWLCQPCGLESRLADTNHQRSVNWRIRYSACGGIGAGLGEGNEGVECGRRHNCLVAQDVYREHECGADEPAAQTAESPGREHRGCSYMVQEMVGIGGQLKTKITERVYVGQAVKHYEDERSTGRYLSREQEGLNRSWCSWCARIVPGKKDLESPAGQSTESVDSWSSGTSV